MRLARVFRRAPHLAAAMTAVVVLAGASGVEVVQEQELDTVDVGSAAVGTDVESVTGNTTSALGPGTAGGVAPAPQPSAPTAVEEVPAQVELHRADLVIRLSDPDPQAVAAANGVEGVAHVAGAAEFETLLVTAPEEGRPVKALSIDPPGFRPMTPDVTAQAPGVWQRLAEGDVVVRHDVAYETKLDLGGGYELHGPDHVSPVRVGAFASNGAPPFADILVPRSVGRSLGAPLVNVLIVALEDNTDVQRAADRIVEAVGGGDWEYREAPVTQQATHTTGTGNVKSQIEAFSYTDLGDGMIDIEDSWIAKYIVTVDVPYLGRTRMHRAMWRQLEPALHEIGAAGLDKHLRPSEFAGAWVPRHMLWNPAKPLSMHAWGLAIDINAASNPYGATPQLHPGIVSIMEKWGFEWGGRWSTPDGMHFELDRIIEVR